MTLGKTGVAAAICVVGVVGLAVQGQEGTGRPDAQMQRVLDGVAKLGPKPIETLPAPLARRQASPADGVFQVIQDTGIVAPDRLPPVGRVEMRTVPGPEGASVGVRVYTPKGNGPFPVLVYYHGGGWVIGSLDSYDASCRGLCSLNGAVVVSVDYRQAPEHKFPAAHDDCYGAFQYVATHAEEFGGDARRVAVVGESAGGNLATAVCLMAKQRGGKMPVHQVLVYPITNYGFDTPSYRANANAKPLNAAMMHWFFDNYLNSPADGENVLVSPLRATEEQMRGLPPATVITAEIDPLRNDGMGYAEKLKAAGVETAARDFPGVTHEFFGMALVVDRAKDANAFVTERLRRAFGG